MMETAYLIVGGVVVAVCLVGFLRQLWRSKSAFRDSGNPIERDGEGGGFAGTGHGHDGGHSGGGDGGGH